MEANFMKDFECCGMTLPSLHELLQHFEELHVERIPPNFQRQQSTQLPVQPDSKAAIATGAFEAVQQQAQQQQHQQTGFSSSNSQRNPYASRNYAQRPQFRPGDSAPTQLQTIPDVEDVQDMDLDMDMDDIGPPAPPQPQQYLLQNEPRMLQRSQFGQPVTAQITPLHVNTMNPLQGHQGLRNSQPTTPVSAGRPGYNPTVSSVNTPTLSAHPLQHQQYLATPDSSTPGTPGELEADFVGDVDNISMAPTQQYLPNQFSNFAGYNFSGNGHDMLDLCIDEPAKRLFNPNGHVAPTPQQDSQSRLGGAQYSENSELARTIREQQRLAGVPEPDGSVPKPFRCPVIGCEKAYKNQNGLKYHKSVRIPVLFCFRQFCSIVLIDTSTVTKPKNSTQTKMEPFQLLIPTPTSPTLEHWGWKRKSPFDVKLVANGTRILMV